MPRLVFFRIAEVAAVFLVIALIALAIVRFSLLQVAAPESGDVAGLPVAAQVQIVRDDRGVPHISARNERDLAFGQGYAEGSDRLFQLDLMRRFVYGTLSEVLGSTTLDADREARTVPVKDLVRIQFERSTPKERAMLQAFADGVNAATARQQKPFEFRALMYTMAPWRPEDSLAVGFATVLDLIDSWTDVAARSADEPLTDPCYDAPVTEGLRVTRPIAHCRLTAGRLSMLLDKRAPLGSNEWASGAGHTTTGRALLANDPHLRLGIPGVWYLADLRAPGYHVAGATLAGTPGVILGHNDRIAWGATNGTVISLSVFNGDRIVHDSPGWQTETFHVRFGRDVIERFYRGKRFFGATTEAGTFVLVDWDAYRHPQSPLLAFEGLDHSKNIEDAERALRAYSGPTQNFELADTTGRVAYTLAGYIPNDPRWGRGIHPPSELSKEFKAIPFAALPHVAPSRDAIVWTANNKMYGPSYPFRLSAQFAPPYRAARIAQLLRARAKYDVPYFVSMQMDTLSLAERELASLVVRRGAIGRDAKFVTTIDKLRAWDGRISPDSVAASSIVTIRQELAREGGGMIPTMLAVRDRVPLLSAILSQKDRVRMNEPWSVAGAVTVRHPLDALGLWFLNGSTFAGNGDSLTVHVQNDGFSQSFRAVWDVGNWDAGGITIPQGESGQPGSPHYTDEAPAWVAGTLLPLPYSDGAVAKAARERQTLSP